MLCYLTILKGCLIMLFYFTGLSEHLEMLSYPTVMSGHLAISNSIFKDTWKCFVN